MELCRPLAAETPVDQGALSGDTRLRQEPAHEEAFVRLTLKEADSTTMLSAIDALKSWAGGAQRVPGGALRQVLFADRRNAGPGLPRVRPQHPPQVSCQGTRSSAHGTGQRSDTWPPWDGRASLWLRGGGRSMVYRGR